MTSSTSTVHRPRTTTLLCTTPFACSVAIASLSIRLAGLLLCSNGLHSGTLCGTSCQSGHPAFAFMLTIVFLSFRPRDGRLQRSDVRAIYTGELFYEIAARRQEHRKKSRKISSRKRQEVQSD